MISSGALLRKLKMKQVNNFQSQALVAYHQSIIMMSSMKILTGEYKNTVFADPEDLKLTEAQRLQKELDRMKAHSDILLQLGTMPNAESSVNVVISSITDPVLTSVYGEDVIHSAKSQFIPTAWDALFYVDKIQLLREKYVEVHKKQPPVVTVGF